MISPQKNVLLDTNLPGLELHARGKVRDIYRVGGNLLIVATDRISAFDFILPTGIPEKGKVLTQLSVFWFEFLKDLAPHHFLTTDVPNFPELAGRCMLVKRARMIEIECVARGYLAGSGWKEYRQTGAVCGIQLPAGLQESERLPEPIFTPATKAQSGHDINIPFEVVENTVGADLARSLRSLTLQVYARASEYAQSKGILIADTKLEFGFIDGQLSLADEVLTPDSSRFWPLDDYQPGRAQRSYDKQYVRDYLEWLGWNKQPPAPELPPEVALQTSQRYREAFRVLTGRPL